MKSRLVVIAAAILFVAFVGCGKKTDQEELYEAENLVNGVKTLGMMTDVDAYSSAYLNSGPFDWFEGPDTFVVPTEWNNSYYYRFILFKWPVDSAGVRIDSAWIYWLMIPDIWRADSAFVDSLITGMDVGVLAINSNIWFHTKVTKDSLHVTGVMRWNWKSTYYDYAYEVSIVPGDSSGEITVTTSQDIRLDAYFLFDSTGAGLPENCWASFDDIVFVRFTFFDQLDEDGYEGYFTLLSEDWKVRHYFPEHPVTF